MIPQDLISLVSSLTKIKDTQDIYSDNNPPTIKEFVEYIKKTNDAWKTEKYKFYLVVSSYDSKGKVIADSEPLKVNLNLGKKPDYECGNSLVECLAGIGDRFIQLNK